MERNDEEETESAVLLDFVVKKRQTLPLEVTHTEVHSSVLCQTWHKRSKFIVVLGEVTTPFSTKNTQVLAYTSFSIYSLFYHLLRCLRFVTRIRQKFIRPINYRQQYQRVFNHVRVEDKRTAPQPERECTHENLGGESRYCTDEKCTQQR